MDICVDTVEVMGLLPTGRDLAGALVRILVPEDRFYDDASIQRRSAAQTIYIWMCPEYAESTYGG